MRKPSLLLLTAFLATMGAVETASAGETIMLRAGDAAGPNAVFAFDKEAKPRAIIVRTTQVGVAGSRFEVSVDQAKTPVFAHIFTAEECTFGDGGSKCQVIIPGASSEFAGVLREFRRGRLARVSIQDAGVMKMDQTVSLVGFTKAARGL